MVDKKDVKTLHDEFARDAHGQSADVILTALAEVALSVMAQYPSKKEAGKIYAWFDDLLQDGFLEVEDAIKRRLENGESQVASGPQN